MNENDWPLISDVITSLFELQAAVGDQRIRLIEESKADVPLPGVCKLGVLINGTNGEVQR